VIALDALGDEVRGSVRRYISNVVPWLPRYAKEQLGLINGYRLRHGGFYWGNADEFDHLAAMHIRNTGVRFSTSLKKEVDPCWR
jgi:hypothetical protein